MNRIGPGGAGGQEHRRRVAQACRPLPSTCSARPLADAESTSCPKSPSSSTASRTTVEFEHGKLPYSHHGKPESFLDVAKNFDVPLEHACGGSCACTTCHVIIREGAAEPERDAGRRGRSPRHRLGPDRAVASRLPGRHHGRRRLRAADVHAQLRAGRRRHPAREVRPEGAQVAGGGRREVDRRRRHRHRARREVSRTSIR